MSLRILQLSRVYDNVQRALTLRRPQRNSLLKLHDWLSSTPSPVAKLDPQERMFAYRESFPHVPQADEYPSAVFALATGVGKTRLMGAIIAYLYGAGESSNFLILAPRRAILRQIIEQLKPASNRYLFSSEALVSSPRIWHAGNLEQFGLPTSELDLGLRGPDIFVFSPQSFVGGERRAARPSSDFSDISLLTSLKERKDLVVLVDEAHHLPGSAGKSERKAWTTLVNDLKPMLQIGLTATPDEKDEDNVLYQYTLAECLSDGLYTKAVHVFTDRKPSSDTISEEDWDWRTIDFGLARLAVKRAALAEASARGIEFPAVEPVLLVAAKDTEHAETVHNWLISVRGLDPEQVLTTHSNKHKSEDDIERLQNLDRPGSPVRVVVNVQELAEGWDVTNVYVFAPLRAMATFKTAVQSMGRGLRLPAGKRIGVPELDQLDVLCFSGQAFEEIVADATREFGTAEDQELAISVDRREDFDDGEPEQLVQVNVHAKSPQALVLPETAMETADWDVSDLTFTANTVRAKNVIGLDLHRLEQFAVEGNLTLSLEAFCRRTAQIVVQRLPFLSPTTDLPLIQKHAADLVVPDESGRVSLDPIFAAELLAETIRDNFLRLPRIFKVLPTTAVYDFKDFDLKLPKSSAAKISPPATWQKQKHFRRLMGPWKKCVHEEALFDSGPELLLAKLLDKSAAVDWWARNDPPQLRLPTPAGRYEPDFVVMTKPDPGVVLIGVKGEHLWQDSDVSEARIKASSASRYAEAVTAAGQIRVEHLLVLGGDVETCQTLEEVRSAAIKNGSFKLG